MTRCWSKPDSNSRSHPLTRSRSLGGAGCVWQRATGPTPPSRSPKRRLFASTSLAGNFRECLGRLHMDKTDFEREIGFGGFEHLAAPSSPSRQRRGLSGRSHLPSKQIQKVAESGFPDEGKNFPNRPI